MLLEFIRIAIPLGLIIGFFRSWPTDRVTLGLALGIYAELLFKE